MGPDPRGPKAPRRTASQTRSGLIGHHPPKRHPSDPMGPNPSTQPCQLRRSCLTSFLKQFRQGMSLYCSRILFHVKAPVNWKLFLVNSKRGLGKCRFWLFLDEQLEIWNVRMNLFCRWPGQLPCRILCAITNLSYLINSLTGNQSHIHPSLYCASLLMTAISGERRASYKKYTLIAFYHT